MSSAAQALDGRDAGRFGGRGDVVGEGRGHAAWSALKAALLRFIERLPEGHDDIDPATLKRLPVPY